MQTIARQVLEYAVGLPEGTPLLAKELLHLGGRAAVLSLEKAPLYVGASGRIAC